AASARRDPRHIGGPYRRGREPGVDRLRSAGRRRPCRDHREEAIQVHPGRPLLVAGPGSIGRLPEVLAWWRPERVLLVGSRRAVAASSALGLLGDAAVTWFD